MNLPVWGWILVAWLGAGVVVALAIGRTMRVLSVDDLVPADERSHDRPLRSAVADELSA